VALPRPCAANWLTAQGLGWIGFLLIVNLLLMLAGNVMEPSSIIPIMAPILLPVAVKLGIDALASTFTSPPG
jgi:C4-dicarboxylate transporter DctM subunit